MSNVIKANIRYRGYIIEPVFHFTNGKSDWNLFKEDAEKGEMMPSMTFEQVIIHINEIADEL